MGILNKTVINTLYGKGTICETIPSDGTNPAKIRVDFSTVGEKLFAEELFTKSCRFVDPAVGAEFERALCIRHEQAVAAEKRRADEKAAIEAAIADTKRRQSEIETAMAEDKMNKVFERINKRAENEANKEKYLSELNKIGGAPAAVPVVIDGCVYYSLHSDRLITEAEYNAMSAFLVNKHKNTNNGESGLLKYKYSANTVRKALQKELSQADKGFSINYSRLNNKFSSAACMCVISYLRYTHPRFEDIAELYDGYVAASFEAAA